MGRMAELAQEMDQQQERQQGMAEYQAWLHYCVTQAKAGKATAEEWSEIDAALGFAPPAVSRSRQLDDNEKSPF